MAINLNSDFNPQYAHHTFKYRIVVLLSKVISNVTPDTIKDIFQFQSYFEMFSYMREIKRFRPDMRIQAFVDARR